jgi:hypothetical protein
MLSYVQIRLGEACDEVVFEGVGDNFSPMGSCFTESRLYLARRAGKLKYNRARNEPSCDLHRPGLSNPCGDYRDRALLDHLQKGWGTPGTLDFDAGSVS